MILILRLREAGEFEEGRGVLGRKHQVEKGDICCLILSYIMIISSNIYVQVNMAP